MHTGLALPASWSFSPRQSIFEREDSFRYGLLKHGHHSSRYPSRRSQRGPHRPLSNSKQASPSVSANLKHRSQTARQAGPTRVGSKAGCATSAHCPLREALGPLISRESETTLSNSGGPEGLMFLIHWLFSAPMNIVTAPTPPRPRTPRIQRTSIPVAK